MPSRFYQGVTGRASFSERKRMSQHISQDKKSNFASTACETPKSLAKATADAIRLYTPATTKFVGYSHCPRQKVMPYQNEDDYQIMMERHNAKGNHLTSFDFPKTTGKMYADKTNLTRTVLGKFAINKANQKYARLVKKGFNS